MKIPLKSHMLKAFHIAVLASTRGTDLQAIIDAIRIGTLTVDLACVVSDKKKCYALEMARAHGFKTYFLDPKEKSRIEFDRELACILEQEKIDLVVLAGYMRILSAFFIGKFRGRIINIHPSLIPQYCGKSFYGEKVHEAVLKAGERETGMTIHYVEEKVDSGPVILQKTCPVFPLDTIEILKQRVQALEKKWYPWVIQQFAEGKIK